ncbi:hypothetical protein [Amycolatopsis magusensis]|uniref:Excreted virulence factor EspC, type VII ESX diderm n=1 Tax=Amycolatopsis magusensis TaxID=882444 RepID=A0ABS4PNQ7_9PSEU|nr:hypothetical protein [Amycolatopsis magusensis]MBP2180488.1 hypothetical protein [Amycolatopsis magusensis]MDI5979471.1 hypothetical protein [Amycolatopsis magusensis]
MSGFKVDAEVVADYARSVEDAAAGLDTAHGSLTGQSLTGEDFGVLGREAGAADAYARAAAALHTQLATGRDALLSAAEALREVAGQHGGGEEDAVATLKKAVES